MRKMHPRLRALTAFLIFGMLIVGAPTFSPAQQTPSASPVHTGPMPNARFYSLVFRHILYLQTHGAQPLVAGTLSPSITAFYTDRVGTDARENEILLAEAQAWKSEVDPVDTQAHRLIDAIHAQTPGGRLTPGEQPPPVPQQLIDLQQKRDAITLKHVQNLHKSFGDVRFIDIDNQIHRSTHVSFRGAAPIQAKH